MSWKLRHLRRGRGNEASGVFVWTTGSWGDSAPHRISTPHGDIESAGPLTTRLEIEDGRLILVADCCDAPGEHSRAPKVRRLAVGLRDRLACSAAPSLSKWHVTVRGGVAERLALKHAEEPRKVLAPLDAAASAVRPHCKLSDSQMGANLAVPALAGSAFMLVCAVIPPAGAALTWFVPVPAVVFCPFPPKACRELGSLHERGTGLDKPTGLMGRMRLSVADRRRGAAAEADSGERAFWCDPPAKHSRSPTPLRCEAPPERSGAAPLAGRGALSASATSTTCASRCTGRRARGLASRTSRFGKAAAAWTAD